MVSMVIDITGLKDNLVFTDGWYHLYHQIIPTCSSRTYGKFVAVISWNVGRTSCEETLIVGEKSSSKEEYM